MTEHEPSGGPGVEDHRDILERMVTEQPRRLTNRMLPAVRNRALAEDLSQETLTRALHSVATLRGPAEEALVCGWLESIAANVVRGHARSAARRPVTVDLDQAPEPVVDSSCALPEKASPTPRPSGARPAHLRAPARLRLRVRRPRHRRTPHRLRRHYAGHQRGPRALASAPSPPATARAHRRRRLTSLDRPDLHPLPAAPPTGPVPASAAPSNTPPPAHPTRSSSCPPSPSPPT